jgi:hypothetical protein
VLNISTLGMISDTLPTRMGRWSRQSSEK